MLAGTDSVSVPPKNLLVKNWDVACSSGKSSLTVTSVTVAEEQLKGSNEGNAGALSETIISGVFSGDTFYASGSSEPYSLPIKVDANNGCYAALLSLTCGSS